MLSDLTIKLTDVTKSYKSFKTSIDHLKYLIFKNKKYSSQQVILNKINLEVYKGECVGIIGKNGSGKTTLLNIIYGVLHADHGHIQINGKVAALLELGTGFNPDMNGIDNIRINALFHGVSNDDLHTKLEQIIKFADIGEYIDQPLKTYSSGMIVRLAFAIIAHVDADILIIDEALAVGDAIFTQKCMRFIREFKTRGTLLFVSHDMAAIQNLCDKAIWLSSGVIFESGSPKIVCEKYLQHVLQEGTQSDNEYVSTNSISTQSEVIEIANAENDLKIEQAILSRGWTTSNAKIIDVDLKKLDSQDNLLFEGGERVCLTVRAIAYTDLKSPIIGFLVRDRLGQDLFGENTVNTSESSTLSLPLGKVATAKFEFNLPLLPNGQYAIACSVADGTLENNIQHHFLHEALIITISSIKKRWGLVGISFNNVQIMVD